MQTMPVQGRAALTDMELLVLSPQFSTEERTREATLFFCDLLHAKVRAFSPKYRVAEGVP
jgi:hypothetical protein